MPDLSLLPELFLQRLQPAVAYAVAIAMVSWLAGLWRLPAALVAAGWLWATLMLGSWSAALIASIALAIGGAVGRWVRWGADGGARPWVANVSAVSAWFAASTLALAGAAGAARTGPWLIGSVGAVAAAIATWCGVVVSETSDRGHYHPLRLRPCERAAGLTAGGLVVALTATAAVALAALQLGQIGPGQSALVATATGPALILAALPRSGARSAATRSWEASIVGSALSVALSLLIP